MTGSHTRMFTPLRVLALALIAILVAGLAYLHFTPDSGSVSSRGSLPAQALPGVRGANSARLHAPSRAG